MSISVDFDNIRRLAKASNQKAQDQLLEELVDFYCRQTKKPRKSEQLLFGDLVVILLKRAGRRSRLKACKQLATSKNTPNKLACALAFSKHRELFDPFLKHSNRLSVDLLKKASFQLTDHHRLSLAARPKLIPPVSAVLVEQGNNEVARRLTDNDSAQFFNRTVTDLLHRSNHDMELQHCVKSRSRRLGIFLTQLKAVLKAELGVVEDDFELSNFAAYVTALNEKGLDATRQQARLFTDDRQTLNRGGYSLSDIMSNLIDLEREEEMIELIAKHLQIGLKRVRYAFYRQDPDEFAIMCYALHIDRMTFKKAAKFRLIAQGLDTAYTTQSVQTFRRVTKKDATHFVSALKDTAVA